MQVVERRSPNARVVRFFSRLGRPYADARTFCWLRNRGSRCVAVRAWAAFLADGMPRYPRLPDGAPLPEHTHRLPEHAHGFAASGFEGGADSAAGLEPQSSYYALLADDATTEEFTAVCAAAGTTLFAGVMCWLFT